MDQGRILKLSNEISRLSGEIIHLSNQMESLVKEKNALLDEWVKEQPYFKVEWIADENGEYTYTSHRGFRRDLQYYIDSAKSKMRIVNERVDKGYLNSRLIKAYVWQNIPYEDIEKELIGLYEPTVIITLKDI